MIRNILNQKEKTAIIDEILHDLPEWFGIEDSIIEYIHEGKNYPMFSYSINEEVVGFISFKQNSVQTLEIYIIGVKKKYHNQGIGTTLLEKLFFHAKAEGYKLVEVKTVDESFYPYNEAYAKTRVFYNKMGFYKLECIKEIWSEKCPCLIMVKPI